MRGLYREFQQKILQTMRWGTGPNTEIQQKFYRQCALGYGANTENFNKNSTDNARWGTGPQHTEISTKILQAMRVVILG